MDTHKTASVFRVFYLSCQSEHPALLWLSFQYHDGAYAAVLDATFVMVARDPENKRWVKLVLTE